jgi:hypothetical protein
MSTIYDLEAARDQGLLLDRTLVRLDLPKTTSAISAKDVDDGDRDFSAAGLIIRTHTCPCQHSKTENN